jgi:hypothetical protein
VGLLEQARPFFIPATPRKIISYGLPFRGDAPMMKVSPTRGPFASENQAMAFWSSLPAYND